MENDDCSNDLLYNTCYAQAPALYLTNVQVLRMSLKKSMCIVDGLTVSRNVASASRAIEVNYTGAHHHWDVIIMFEQDHPRSAVMPSLISSGPRLRPASRPWRGNLTLGSGCLSRFWAAVAFFQPVIPTTLCPPEINDFLEDSIEANNVSASVLFLQQARLAYVLQYMRPLVFLPMP